MLSPTAHPAGLLRSRLRPHLRSRCTPLNAVMFGDFAALLPPYLSRGGYALTSSLPASVAATPSMHAASAGADQ